MGLVFQKSVHQTVEAVRTVSPISYSFSDRFDPLLKIQNDSFSLRESTDIPSLNNLSESAYIAIDDTTGQVLLSKNASTQVSIASLTKIMSAMIALDLMSPQETITVSQLASIMPPTKIGVSPGERLTLDELLHAMLMTSANDAGQAVADGIDAKYNSHIFIWAMNEKARLLGLKHTHFGSAQGFDTTDNYSTASDLAIISHYAMTHYPEIAQIVGEDYVQLPATATHKEYDLYNWNGLLDVYPNISGIKIGNTKAAGYTNIVVAQRNGKKVLVVLLGASGVLERDMDAATLLDSAFALYSLPPIAITTTDLQAKYNTWHYWN